MSKANGTPAGGSLVLVTGAAGKIGRYVVKRLTERGFAVRAITSKPRPAGEPVAGVEWRIKDFNRSIDFAEDADGCEAVIHLAAEIAERAHMQRVNVEATCALASASERAGVSVFCYTSSAAVYGHSLSRMVTEESPTLTPDKDDKSEYSAPDFLRTYGRTKLLGEISLRNKARSFDCVILRPTMVVDVGDIVDLGNLSHIRKSLTAKRHAHYVYIADVADAIVWSVEQRLVRNGPGADVSIYNLAEDEFRDCSYEAILKRLRRDTGNHKFNVIPAPAVMDRLMSSVRFGNFRRRFAFGEMFFATDKLRNAGFRPRFGLEHLYRRAIHQMTASEPSASTREPLPLA